MKKTVILLALLVLNFSVVFPQQTSKVKKLPDDERMAWWREAKFGMFIHWGAYSIIGGERDGEICDGGAERAMDKLD